mmetsp:Transcript_19698/g.55388  ORF Transcript_19698/g.55388 Transcript_19698/m.55388 type:complete len:105 (+) Transcript_19698:145-459(+)
MNTRSAMKVGVACTTDPVIATYPCEKIPDPAFLVGNDSGNELHGLAFAVMGCGSDSYYFAAIESEEEVIDSEWNDDVDLRCGGMISTGTCWESGTRTESSARAL